MVLPSSVRVLPLRNFPRCLCQCRVFSTARPTASTVKQNPLRASTRSDHLTQQQQQRARHRRSMYISTAGLVGSSVGLCILIQSDPFNISKLDEDDKPAAINRKHNSKLQLDASPGAPVFPNTGGPPVLRVPGQDDSLQQVPTGNSSVPYFPTTIRLPSQLDARGVKELKQGDELPMSPSPSVPGSKDTTGEEYQLLGLGIRSVSFLRIQVYVVGLYVAKSDIGELQRLLVRTAIRPPGEEEGSSYVADAATSLVPKERERLKELLLDPERSTVVWNEIVKQSQTERRHEGQGHQADNGVRTALRIVPTRNTDFIHLRDGFVRGITARATQNKTGEFQDESFGDSVNDFKSVFGGGFRKSAPKGQALLLHRNARGVFDALYQADPGQPMRWMGRVDDERISRLVWLHYLGGKTVASEPARQNIVEGVMGVVERPIGTHV